MLHRQPLRLAGVWLSSGWMDLVPIVYFRILFDPRRSRGSASPHATGCGTCDCELEIPRGTYLPLVPGTWCGCIGGSLTSFAPTITGPALFPKDTSSQRSQYRSVPERVEVSVQRSTFVSLLQVRNHKKNETTRTNRSPRCTSNLLGRFPSASTSQRWMLTLTVRPRALTVGVLTTHLRLPQQHLRNG
jgi:hypothetical protein